MLTEDSDSYIVVSGMGCMQHANAKAKIWELFSRLDYDTGVTPSAIADHLGLSHARVFTCLIELREARLIMVETFGQVMPYKWYKRSDF